MGGFLFGKIYFFCYYSTHMNKKTLSIIVVTAIIIGGGAYYIYTDILSIQTINKETDVELSNDMNIEAEGDYTIEINPVDNEDNIPVPNLDREIVFSADILAEKQDKLRQTIEEISSELKKDSNLVDNWIELGVYRKNIGDYDGAIEAWNYALVLQPKSSITFNNLGDLYGYYLKDSIKAEQNFLKAIENAPKDIYLYFKISEFYIDVLGDADKARAIVQQGIDENPNSAELQNLLNSLQ